jgi:hypothetical protein
MDEFCPKCEDYREIEVVERDETYVVAGHKVYVPVRTMLCVQCGESIGTDEDDQKILDDIYRRAEIK